MPPYDLGAYACAEVRGLDGGSVPFESYIRERLVGVSLFFQPTPRRGGSLPPPRYGFSFASRMRLQVRSRSRASSPARRAVTDSYWATAFEKQA